MCGSCEKAAWENKYHFIIIATNSRLLTYIPMHAAELAKHARFFFLAPFQNVPAKFKVFERNMTAKIVL